MSFVTLIAVTFGMIGMCFVTMSFCAIALQKTMCQKALCCDDKHNICIKPKRHSGSHTTATGEEF